MIFQKKKKMTKRVKEKTRKNKRESNKVKMSPEK
jgi:hypothetical protein